MMKFIFSFLFPVFLFLQNAASQEAVIYLKNPSFEGIPAEGSLNGRLPDGWFNCGFKDESIPDVHPKDNSAFGVTLQAADGNTYLGMVVRSNDTWESVGQELNSPLQAGTYYRFNIQLARSLTYESYSRSDVKVANFTTPCLLRIWGGNKPCEKAEMLGESSLVINTRWLTNKFVLQPSQNYTHLVLEAFYNTPTGFSYNGNLLIDDASNLVPIDSTALSDSLTSTATIGVNGEKAATVPKEVASHSGSARHEFAEQHMGTEFRIILYTENEYRAREAAAAAFARIARLEQVLSHYREDSELSLLSATAGTDQRLRVSDDLWKVLVYSREVADRSKGAFDFTAGAATKIWRRAFRQETWPGEAEVQKALATVGFKKVILKSNQEVAIWQPGLLLDLGGIAKGYAVDEALKTLKDSGITSALVDGGGDIAVGEAPPGKAGWKLKRTVYDEAGKITTEPITLVNRAIATSGDTEHYLNHNGKKYSHIIDPRTGYSVTTGEIVSVVAPSCMEADAWATALSVEVGTRAYLWMKKQGMQAYFSK